MEQNYITQQYIEIAEPVFAEIVEKKSRFITSMKTVHTEQEAIVFVEEMKKKYWDASHNCSAYVIGIKGELVRCNDDGEPGQTAGRPMLEVLLQEEIKNICVVVTRYFGGTLLGTGGLVRAYQSAVKEGLEKAQKVCWQYGILLQIVMNYNFVSQVQYILARNKYKIKEAVYETLVTFLVFVPFQDGTKLKRELEEATGAQITIIEVGCEYGICLSEC